MKLTQKQERLLETIGLDSKGVNWSGTSQQARASLVKKGLVRHLNPERGHTQWATYSLTDLGFSVLAEILAARKKES